MGTALQTCRCIAAAWAAICPADRHWSKLSGTSAQDCSLSGHSVFKGCDLCSTMPLECNPAQQACTTQGQPLSSKKGTTQEACMATAQKRAAQEQHTQPAEEDAAQQLHSRTCLG